MERPKGNVNPGKKLMAATLGVGGIAEQSDGDNAEKPQHLCTVHLCKFGLFGREVSVGEG
jgi:hypothetical protein